VALRFCHFVRLLSLGEHGQDIITFHPSLQ
jgi:hypothetical protein